MTPETLHRATLARLVRRAQRGDADAFERLARPCGPTLYRVAASCLHGHDADAADVVQNALIAAWRNIGSLREPRYFKTWLIRITINACRSLQRARATTVPLEAVDEERLDASLRQAGRSDETTRAAAASDADASFRVLVATAGEGCALAITLYYGEGYNTAEIAELLDTTAENVRQRLSRGRKRIARALGCDPRGVAADEEPDGPRRISERGCRPRALAETDAPLMQAANPA